VGVLVRALCLTLAVPAVPAPAHALPYLTLPGVTGEAGPPGPSGSNPLEVVTFVFANGPNVPEPTAVLLVALGCVALGVGARRRRVG